MARQWDALNQAQTYSTTDLRQMDPWIAALRWDSIVEQMNCDTELIVNFCSLPSPADPVLSKLGPIVLEYLRLVHVKMQQEGNYTIRRHINSTDG